jgi:hypothetical protein
VAAVELASFVVVADLVEAEVGAGVVAEVGAGVVAGVGAGVVAGVGVVAKFVAVVEVEEQHLVVVLAILVVGELAVVAAVIVEQVVASFEIEVEESLVVEPAS